ncbi:MAG: hypothetical protein K0R24_1004 [Gammaproteobacteria bacterium]|jgi:hypothetical protein|nr:hypothetical protein [Gammaproteobacteria bacterium]
MACQRFRYIIKEQSIRYNVSDKTPIKAFHRFNNKIKREFVWTNNDCCDTKEKCVIALEIKQVKLSGLKLFPVFLTG